MTTKKRKKYKRRSTAKMIELRDAICEIVDAQAPVTLRTVFYVMADQGLIAKTPHDYHNVVVRLSGDLRKNGRLPYEWIVDPTRWVDSPLTFTSVRGGHAVAPSATVSLPLGGFFTNSGRTMALASWSVDADAAFTLTQTFNDPTVTDEDAFGLPSLG